MESWEHGNSLSNQGSLTVSKKRVSAANGSLRYIVRNFASALKIWDPLGNEWITLSNWRRLIGYCL